MTISATQWGSTTATRRALLIHGITMSSNSWEGLAQLLVAEGFFVVAPNLLAHAGRQGNTDYRISAFAEDLRPYFVMGTSYDVIIGHSFGVILLDPGLESTEEQNKMNFNLFLKETANIKPVDVHMVKNPAWSRRDCVLRTLGLSMCDRTAVEVFRQNSPWSFNGLLKKISPHVKITVLVSDPKFGLGICNLEHIPRDVERLNVRALTGIGHWIQYECPDVIMDAIPLPRAKL